MNSRYPTLRDHHTLAPYDPWLERRLAEQHGMLLRGFGELQSRIYSLETKLVILDLQAQTRACKRETRLLQWLMVLGSIALWLVIIASAVSV